MRRTPSSVALRSIAALLVVAALAAVVTVRAQGAGSPDIALDKSTGGRILFGEDDAVTLTARHLSGGWGYNLSFRDVLPAGTHYVAGSAGTAAGEPTIIANAPAAGSTTLIWLNVADLSPSSSHALGYSVRHDQGTLGVGSSYTNTAEAFVNADPRYVPDFDLKASDGLFEAGGDDDGDGLPIAGVTSSTGNGAANATTTIAAFDLTLDEPNTEGEILRGVHDHQTVYTFTIENNLVNATNGMGVDAWFPAGLEFLGCGTSDATTDAHGTNAGSAVEYPGAGPINPGNAPSLTNPCPAPSLVETVQTDPDGAGPRPNAVYTHVQFTGLGNLSSSGPGRILRFDIVAGIPVRENTLDWNGAVAGNGIAPSTAGPQTANLDNNTGSETADEQELTVYAVASGTYSGTLFAGAVNPQTDDDTIQRVAEDLSVHKSASTGALLQGDVTTWTLLIESSEYRYVDDVRVTDHVPDGLCPIGAGPGGDVNHETTPPVASSECGSRVGVGPSVGALGANSAPYTGVTEAVDGTWVVSWDDSTVPALARIAPSTSVTITFPTVARAFYQESFADAAPVLSHDSWKNTVDILGADFTRCAPADPTCTGAGTKIFHTEIDGVDDVDASSAGQAAGGPVLDKKVSLPVVGTLDCSTASYIDTTAVRYGPGDRVCWRLRLDFPASLDTTHVPLADFLPAGVLYEAGSWQTTANNTVSVNAPTIDPATTEGQRVSWTVSPVDIGSQVFEVVFSSTIADPRAFSPADIVDNLFKYASVNTAGASFPLRDKANFEWAEPTIALTKGVRDVDGVPGGGNAANTDNVNVEASDVVTYRVDIANTGNRAAQDAEVWDVLPATFSCAMVSVISDGGSCNTTPTPDRIEWTGVAVAIAGTKTLTYRVTIPATVGPGETFDNTAGVRRFDTPTNRGGTFTYIPSSNIDPTQEASANTGSARDTSRVQTRLATLTKARTTSVTQTGNSASQATIGERIDYTVTVTVPQGTTVGSLAVPSSMSDALSNRSTYVAGSGSVTLASGTVISGDSGTAEGFTWDTASGSLVLTFPGPYVNAPGSGDDVFVILANVTVDDEAQNTRGASVGNTATYSWRDSQSVARTASQSVSTTIVEPSVQIDVLNDATGPVAPGGAVGYTVRFRNVVGTTTPSTTNVSTANDVVVTDVVPAGLIVNVGSISGGGTYDAPSRTITWLVPTLAPSATYSTRTYTATLDTVQIGQAVLTNVGTITTTSLPGVSSLERTTLSTTNAGYSASDTSSITLVAATLTKSVSPASRTIGERTTSTLNVTIPRDLVHYDATVVDTLPDGLTYESTVTAQVADCASPASSGTTTTLTPEPNVNGTTRLGWYLGDLPSCTTDRTVQITYRATVDGTYAAGPSVVHGNTLVNSARLSFDATDKLVDATVRGAGTIPDTSTADSIGAPQQATVAVTEPSLTIDKRVGGQVADSDFRRAEPSTSLSYTVAVANSAAGDASTAYDTVATDMPDAELTNVVVAPQAGVTVLDGWTAGDPDIRWRIDTIAPGATVTLAYTAELVPSAQLTDGITAVNTAAIPAFYGVDTDALPPAPHRTYVGGSDTVTVEVDLPQLTIAKTTGGAGFPESANAEIAQPFGWRVVITNASATATAHDVSMEDTLPPNWEYVAASALRAPGGALEPTIVPSATGDRLTWTAAGDIAPGGTLTLTYTARPVVGAATTPGLGVGNPHVNTARATADDASGASASASGPYASGPDTATAILTRPSLSLVKTPDGAAAVPGSPSQYQVLVTNTGTARARGVRVTDVLPAGVTYTPAAATSSVPVGFSEVSVSPNTPSAGRTTVVWQLADLPASGAGSSVTLTVPVLVDLPAVNGSTLTNTATVTATEIPVATPAMTDTGSLVIGSAPVWLTASRKTSAPASGTSRVPGQDIAYTIHYANTGNESANNTVVTDTIPVGTSYVAGSAASTPTASVQFRLAGVWQAPEPADPSGVEAVRWLLGTVTAPSGAGDLRFTARVALPLPNGTVITNSATLTSDRNPLPGVSLGPVTHPVTSAPVISLVKDVDRTTLDLNGGRTLRYGLHATNTGTETATGVEIVDAPPVGTVLSAVEAGGATVECATGTAPFVYGACPTDLAPVASIRWTAASLLAPSGALDVGFSVFVPVPGGGLADGTVIENQATIDTVQTPPVTSNTVRTTLRTSPILELKKAVDQAGPVAPGATLAYTMDFASKGTRPAGSTVLTDPIPAGTSYVPGSASPGAELLVGDVWQSAEPADPSAVKAVRWPLGNLEGGTAGTVRMSVRLAGVMDTGTVIRNEASLGATDVPTLTASASTTVESAPTVSIEKTTTTVQAEKGDRIVYRLLIRTGGTSEADVVVTDPLPAGLAFVSATEGGRLSGRQVRWNLGRQAPGEELELFVTTSLVGDDSAGQTIRNVASVSAVRGGAVLGANASGATRVRVAVRTRGAAVVATPDAAPCAKGGTVRLSGYRALVGVPSALVATASDRDGSAAAGVRLVLRSGAWAIAAARTDARGRVAFQVTPKGGMEALVVESTRCGRSLPVAVVRSVDCAAGLRHEPQLLRAGEATLRIRVRIGGRPAARTVVRIRGLGVDRSVRADAAGRAVVRVAPRAAGVLVLTAPDVLDCASRVAVVQPVTDVPVTG